MEGTVYPPLVPTRWRVCLEIEAIQVGTQPWEQIARWCGGTAIRNSVDNGWAFIVIDDSPGKRAVRAHAGDWIAHTPQIRHVNSWTVIPDALFRETYERIH
jgi:hypothetical protein